MDFWHRISKLKKDYFVAVSEVNPVLKSELVYASEAADIAMRILLFVKQLIARNV